MPNIVDFFYNNPREYLNFIKAFDNCKEQEFTYSDQVFIKAFAKYVIQAVDNRMLVSFKNRII